MKPKILFVYDCVYDIKDGLYAALELLRDDYDISKVNLHRHEPLRLDVDFVLGWGAFNSPVDRVLTPMKIKKGLCIGGVTKPHKDSYKYDVLFYETDWYKFFISDHKNIYHAFGVNSDIMHCQKTRKIWDYMTCGAFASWKRQEKMLARLGPRIAVGDIQEDNPQESLSIVAKLLANGVMVGNQTDEETMARIYNASRVCYIPAAINGGGERAVLEARACGLAVEVENDNPKLQELVNGPLYDHRYYADQLRVGINSCL